MENLLSVPRWGSASGNSAEAPDVADHPAWAVLKNEVQAVRAWQREDGSIDFTAEATPPRAEVEGRVGNIIGAVDELAPLLPHDAGYLAALTADLRHWAGSGFGVPDFLDSLLAFQPAAQRQDGLAHLVVFPMYTQNGNPNRNLEAVLLRVVWPEWIAELERTRYDNPGLLPIAFEDFTAGYDTNSAVLFPETVAAREKPDQFSWGAIFCDREAARFRRVATAAVNALGIELPEDARRLIHEQELTLQTFVLWDLLHDRTHNRGDLPFDPFMIKQRAPFWMYALEELRCDLTAFREAVQLESEGLPQGRNIQYAVLFDRLFRFPVTGARRRNYDGLGGQLLFAYLHQHGVLQWCDNKLRFDWDRIPDAVTALSREIDKLYRDGVDRPKLVHWFAAHKLISAYLAPHPGSVWAKGPDALPLADPPRKLVDQVLPDEFPLSMFYEVLGRKLRDVIASTKGITAQAAA